MRAEALRTEDFSEMAEVDDKELIQEEERKLDQGLEALGHDWDCYKIGERRSKEAIEEFISWAYDMGINTLLRSWKGMKFKIFEHEDNTISLFYK